MDVVRALGQSIQAFSRQSGPWFAAAAAVSALPLDCKLAASQTSHICLGLAQPVDFVPGFGPLPLCWIWFVCGALVGGFLVLFLAVCFALAVLLRNFLMKHTLAREQAVARMEEPRQLAPNARLVNRMDLPMLVNGPMSDDARVELLHLLVQGGNDLLV